MSYKHKLIYREYGNKVKYSFLVFLVIFDAECPFQPDGRRVLHAFVGGLDLTGILN